MDHRPHRPVEDEDSLPQQLHQQIRSFGRHPEFFPQRCAAIH
jgi:hypothetical protein